MRIKSKLLVLSIQECAQEGVQSLLSVNNFEELTKCLADCANIEFEEPADLQNWTDILNVLDKFMEELLLENADEMILADKELSVSKSKERINYEKSIRCTKSILSFTAFILKNSYNKEVYNSTEHLQSFLRAYDDEISSLALDALTNLAEPPLTHRFLNYNRHYTSMHKKTSLCIPMFQIVESANWSFPLSAKDLLLPAFVVKKEYSLLEFDFSSKSKPSVGPISAGDMEVEVSDSSNNLGENVFVIEDIVSDSRSLKEIVSSSQIPLNYQFALLWKIRLQKCIQTYSGRIQLLKQQYQSILVLICCHPNSAILSHFFQDKSELLRDFIYMIRNGPGSTDYDPRVPIELRELACQCLIAIVESRDTSSISVLGRFSWLQYDLGTNRGQYMGLLPCMLRSATAFLMSISSNRNAKTMKKIKSMDRNSSTNNSSKPSSTSSSSHSNKKKANKAITVVPATQSSVEEDDSHLIQLEEQIYVRLRWTEQLLVLTTALFSTSSALPALTDNGFISLIISVIQTEPSQYRSNIHLYVETMLVQILGFAVTNHSTALNIFKDMNGLEIILNRLLSELEMLHLSSSDNFKKTSSESTANSTVNNTTSTSSSSTASASGASTRQSSRLRRTLTSSSSNSEQDMSVDSTNTLTSESQSKPTAPPPSPPPPAISSPKKLFISGILTFCSTYFQHSHDTSHGQLLRSPTFQSVFQLILQNVSSFPPYVMSPALAIIADIINDDPSILGYFLSIGLCKDLLRALSHEKMVFNSDCFLAASNTLSSFSLKSEGLELILEINPLPSLFSVFHQSSYLPPHSKLLLTDFPLVLGTNLEELTRHHPALLKPCLQCLIDEANTILLQSETLQASVVSEDCSVRKDFLNCLHFATSVLNCLEPLLNRSSNVTAFLGISGADILLKLLALAMSPPRYFMSALASATDPTIYSLGHYRIIKGVSKCFHLAAEHDCKQIIPILFEMIDKITRKFKLNLASFWKHYYTKSKDFIPISQHKYSEIMKNELQIENETSFPLCLILETISKKPLQEYWKEYGGVADSSSSLTMPIVSATTNSSKKRLRKEKKPTAAEKVDRVDLEKTVMSNHLSHFIAVLQSFVTLDYLVDALATAIQVANSRTATRSALDHLTRLTPFKVLTTLILDIYTVSQTELCRSRGGLFNLNERERKVGLHPKYRLLVVANDGVVVKDGIEDNGKKVYKIDRGIIVDAYERSMNSSHSLRYRVDDGWISLYRGGSSSEPQVEVIDILSKSGTEKETEVVATSSNASHAFQRKLDFEKFANVTPRRGGFMAFFHFHSCMRHLLCSLSWSFVPTDPSMFSLFNSFGSMSSSCNHALKLIPVVVQCLSALLPSSSSSATAISSSSSSSSASDNQRLSIENNAIGSITPSSSSSSSSSSAAGGAASDKSSTALLPEPVKSSITAESVEARPDSFFIKSDIPAVDSFDIADTFRTVHVVELAHYLLFDDRPGHRGEANCLLMSHFYYSGLMEKLVQASMMVYLSSLNPGITSTVGGTTTTTSTAGGTTATTSTAGGTTTTTSTAGGTTATTSTAGGTTTTTSTAGGTTTTTSTAGGTTATTSTAGGTTTTTSTAGGTTTTTSTAGGTTATTSTAGGTTTTTSTAGGTSTTTSTSTASVERARAQSEGREERKDEEVDKQGDSGGRGKGDSDDDDDDDDDDDLDNHPSSSAKAAVKSQKVKNRVQMDRQFLAMSNVDIIIDLWKQTFHSFATTTRTNTALQEISDEKHDFDLLVFQRQLFTTLVRYLYQIWSHDSLYTVQPNTVRNVLELVQTVIKALVDTKSGELRSRSTSSTALKENPRLRPARRTSVTNDVVRSLLDMGFLRTDIINAMNTLNTQNVDHLARYLIENSDNTDILLATLRNSLNSVNSSNASAIPTSSSSSAPSPLFLRSQLPFLRPSRVSVDAGTETLTATATTSTTNNRPSESGVGAGSGEGNEESKQEVGGMERRILSGVLELNVERSQDLEAVARLFDDLAAREDLAAIRASATAASGATTSSSSGSSRTSANTSTSTTTSSTLTFPELFQRAAASASSSLTLPLLSLSSWQNIFPTTPSASVSATPTSSLTHLLPLTPKTTTEDLNNDRQMMQVLYKHVYTAVPRACLRLIERGLSTGLVPFKTHNNLIVHSVMPREMSTVMVLTQMLKCLDRPNWSDTTLKIIQLTSLFPRVIGLLREGMIEANSGALFGILHAILLLLSGRVTSSVRPSSSSSNEMMFLVFSRDSRFSRLYPLLIDAIDSSINKAIESTAASATTAETSEGLESRSHNGSVSGTISDDPSIDWIAPAMLILDAITQPLLVDRRVLRDALKELEKINQIKQSLPNSRDPVISPELSAALRSEFLDENSGQSSTATSASVASTESAASEFKESDSSRIDLGLLLSVTPSPDADAVAEGGEVVAGLSAAGTPLAMEVDRLVGEGAEDVRAAPKPATSAAPPDEAPTTTTSATNDPSEALLRLPLVATGLSLPLRKRCMDLCLKIVDHLRSTSKRLTSLAQAVLQMIAHLTRDSEITDYFYSLNGLHRILLSSVHYDGISSCLFTIIQHFIEDSRHLRGAMEIAVKSAMHRLLKSRRSTSKSSPDDKHRVLFRSFVEMVTPLVYRSQDMFLSTMRRITQMTRVGTYLYISLRPSECLTPPSGNGGGGEEGGGIDSQSSKPDKESRKRELEQEDTSATVLSASKRRREMSEDSSASDRGTSLLPASALASTPSHSSHSSSDTIQSAVDELLLLLFSQWERLQRLIHDVDPALDMPPPPPPHSFVVIPPSPSSSSSSAPSSLTHSPSSQLSLSEIIMLIADLVSSVPGLATCLHRFHLMNAKDRFPKDKHGLLDFCLRRIPHAIIGDPIATTSFLSFLVHCLVAPDLIPASAQHVPPTSGVNTAAATAEAAAANAATNTNTYRNVLIHKLVGVNARDAASYLVASLASRAGDGRRRTVKELLNALRVERCRLDTTERLRAIQSIVDSIQSLFNLKPQWKSRDLLLLPAKEILSLLASLKAYATLNETLSNIDTSHPMAVQVSVSIAVVLESVIRKGIPLLYDSLRIVTHSGATSRTSTPAAATLDRYDNTGMIITSSFVNIESAPPPPAVTAVPVTPPQHVTTMEVEDNTSELFTPPPCLAPAVAYVDASTDDDRDLNSSRLPIEEVGSTPCLDRSGSSSNSNAFDQHSHNIAHHSSDDDDDDDDDEDDEEEDDDDEDENEIVVDDDDDEEDHDEEEEEEEEVGDDDDDDGDGDEDAHEDDVIFRGNVGDVRLVARVHDGDDDEEEERGHADEGEDDEDDEEGNHPDDSAIMIDHEDEDEEDDDENEINAGFQIIGEEDNDNDNEQHIQLDIDIEAELDGNEVEDEEEREYDDEYADEGMRGDYNNDNDSQEDEEEDRVRNVSGNVNRLMAFGRDESDNMVDVDVDEEGDDVDQEADLGHVPGSPNDVEDEDEPEEEDVDVEEEDGMRGGMAVPGFVDELEEQDWVTLEPTTQHNNYRYTRQSYRPATAMTNRASGLTAELARLHSQAGAGAVRVRISEGDLDSSMYDVIDRLPHLAARRTTGSSQQRMQRTSSVVDFRNFISHILPPGTRMASEPLIESGGSGGTEGTSSTQMQQNLSTVHPLLTVTDARPVQRPYLRSGGTATRGQGGAGLGMIDAIFSAVAAQSNMYYDSRQQQVRLGAPRRRLTAQAGGQVVSDRRWGTDLGDVEVVGLRVQSLASSIEQSLSDMIVNVTDSAGVTPVTNTSRSRIVPGTSTSDSLRDSSSSSRYSSRQTGSGNSSAIIRTIRRAMFGTGTGTAAPGVGEEERVGEDSTGQQGSGSAEGVTEGAHSRSRQVDTLTILQQLAESLQHPEASSEVDGGDDAEEHYLTRVRITVDQSAPSPAPVPGSASSSVEASDDTVAHLDRTVLGSPPTNYVGTTPLQIDPPASISEVQANETAPSLASEASPVSMEVVSDTRNAEVEGSSSRTELVCPPGVDPEIWLELPEDLQRELCAQMEPESGEDTEGALLAATSLDREALAALPSHVRNEVLREEATTRSARISSTLPAATSGQTSSTTPSAAEVGGSGGTTSEFSFSEPPADDNTTFLYSLPPDLRRDVLLSANQVFLDTLPAAAQEEARGLREEAARQQMRVGLLPMTTNPAELLFTTSSSATASAARQGGMTSTQRLARISQEIENQNRVSVGGGFNQATMPTEQPVAITAPVSDSVNLSEDRLTDKPPFGKRVVARLLMHLVLSKKNKCPRPLMRLLAVCCRYRACRSKILIALLSMLNCDARSLAGALEAIPSDRRLAPIYAGRVGGAPGSMHSDGSGGLGISSSGAMPLIDSRTSSGTHLSVDMREYIESFHEEVLRLTQRLTSRGISSVNTRRLLSALHYITRKTEHLVWYDIMDVRAVIPLESSSSSSSSGDVWMFSILIRLLERAVGSTSAMLDVLLHVIEVLCEPLVGLTIEQANTLVGHSTRSALTARGGANATATAGLPVVVPGTAEPSTASQSNSSSGGRKKRKVLTTGGAGNGDGDGGDSSDGDDNSPIVDSDNNVNNNNRENDDNRNSSNNSDSNNNTISDIPVISSSAAPMDTSSQEAAPVTDAAPPSLTLPPSALPPAQPIDTVIAEPLPPGTVHLPFPVLTPAMCRVLASVAGAEGCGGTLRNRMLRILRALSAHDLNCLNLLASLRDEGETLAKYSIDEVAVVHVLLLEVASKQEDASSAMAQPLLSTPSSVTELRLLRVLRFMTALRLQSGGGNADPGYAAKASGYIKGINFNNLWQMLSECLDAVRQLEGIKDSEPLPDDYDMDVEEHNTSSGGGGGSSSSGTGATMSEFLSPNKQPKAATTDSLQPSVSSLTMRFMPLIECFLTVCGSTVLRTPPVVAYPQSSPGSSPKSAPLSAAGNASSSSSSSASTTAIAATGTGNAASVLPAATGTTSTTTGNTSHKRKDHPTTESEAESSSTPSSATRGVPSDLDLAMIRTLSCPGARFRQHIEYREMQLELNDSPDANRLLSFVDRNRVLLNMVLRQNVYLLESSFHPLAEVPKLRHLLHFDIKRAYFKMKLKRMKQAPGRQLGTLRLSVHRQSVFEESFQKLRYCTAEEMRRKLSVSFYGEEGVDAGGLTREWYSVLAKEIFNANYCLFVPTIDNVTFQPYPHSHINAHHLDYFKFVGRVIGKAICDGHLLDAHFTRSFYKHILGLPVSYHDMEGVEPEYYKNLQTLLNHPLEHLGLELCFSAELDLFGSVMTVDLVDQGRYLAVTDENKFDYVRLISHHRMTTSIIKQTDAFLEGFHELVPPELISIFDAQELELLISGLPDIDLDDLRANTEYHSYKSTDPVIGYFWSALRSFSKEEKALFLQFVTGTSKVPLDGFQALQGARGIQRFSIHKAYGSHLLPTAHTCFNQLDLPEYSSETELREKLLIAIKEGSVGFGFA